MKLVFNVLLFVLIGASIVSSNLVMAINCQVVKPQTTESHCHKSKPSSESTKKTETSHSDSGCLMTCCHLNFLPPLKLPISNPSFTQRRDNFILTVQSVRTARTEIFRPPIFS